MTGESTGEGRWAMLMRAAQTGDGDAYCQLMQELEVRIRREVQRQRGFLAIEDVEDLVQ